jgi:hypothetical protein
MVASERSIRQSVERRQQAIECRFWAISAARNGILIWTNLDQFGLILACRRAIS